MNVTSHNSSLVMVECWFAPWSALEDGVDLVEFSLHAFEPIEVAVVVDLPDALVQFDLSLLGFKQLVALNVLVDVDDELWHYVQRGEYGGIESKGKTGDENGVGSQQHVSALFQESHAFCQIAVGVLNAVERVDVLFGQFAEADEIH